MTRLAGKVALGTGGRSGIGRACAAALADDGARVITAQRRPSEDLETIAADLADPDEPERIVAELVARAGRLDVLVNSAGVMQEATAPETTFADWQRMLAVNLTAPFLLIKHALPHLRVGARSSTSARSRASRPTRAIPPTAHPRRDCTVSHGRLQSTTGQRACAATPWRPVGLIPSSTRHS